MEANQASIDAWMDKCINGCNGILISFEKEGNSDICQNLDAPWGLYVKWNRPVTKRQIL